jgi:putative aldouronate transport system permease protein
MSEANIHAGDQKYVISDNSSFRKFFNDIKKNSGLLFLALPGILILFVFNYIPLFGLILPFKNYRYDLGFLNSPWAGFSNFEFLFKGDVLARVIRNTLGYNFVFIFLGTSTSVTFALMLFELGKKSVRVYQTILFFPYFISWVVASFAFRAIFDMEYGVINKLLLLIGREPVMWYNEPRHWPVILVIVAVWKGLGYGTVIYYAALMGADQELFEAARIDGAGKFQQTVSISIPLIQPIIVMMIILQIGKIFYSDFGLFYNVTLNSALLYPATDVIDTFVYRALIDMGDIGMASAAGFFQAVVGFALVLATNFAAGKINSENSLF